MRRWSWLSVGLCAAAITIAAGCNKGGSGSGGGDGLKRMILLTNGDDPFWDAMRSGMEDAAKDLQIEKAGLKVEMDKNDNTPKGQVDKLNQYASQTDIAAVAISVTDAANVAIGDAMRALQKQGIKVITVDSDIDREKGRDARFAYLGTDNVLGGQELGKAAKGLKPDGGKYATFVGLKGAANAIERISGFGAAAGPKFEKKEDKSDNMDLSVAQKNVRDAISNHPDLDTLVGIWAYNAHAIVETVKGPPDIRSKYTIVVFDANPKAIGHLENGYIDAMIVQNPYDMGYRGTKLMKALVEGDHKAIADLYPGYDATAKKFNKPDDDLLITGLKVVVPNSGSPLKKEMFAPTTEFLPLAEFRKWLDSHKLTGS